MNTTSGRQPWCRVSDEDTAVGREGAEPASPSCCQAGPQGIVCLSTQLTQTMAPSHGSGEATGCTGSLERIKEEKGRSKVMMPYGAGTTVARGAYSHPWYQSLFPEVRPGGLQPQRFCERVVSPRLTLFCAPITVDGVRAGADVLSREAALGPAYCSSQAQATHPCSRHRRQYSEAQTSPT